MQQLDERHHIRIGKMKTYPILVIENDCVCSDEVDAQPARPSAEQEETRCLGVVASCLENVHLFPTFHGFR